MTLPDDTHRGPWPHRDSFVLLRRKQGLCPKYRPSKWFQGLAQFWTSNCPSSLLSLCSLSLVDKCLAKKGAGVINGKEERKSFPTQVFPALFSSFHWPSTLGWLWEGSCVSNLFLFKMDGACYAQGQCSTIPRQPPDLTSLLKRRSFQSPWLQTKRYTDTCSLWMWTSSESLWRYNQAQMNLYHSQTVPVLVLFSAAVIKWPGKNQLKGEVHLANNSRL